MGEINPKLLKPHPKNNEYYSDLSQEKYEEIKRSIAFHGIRDPLKVLPDYTIISGHQRHRIALELGLDKVPIEIKDISPEEAEYLLIAENEERRQSDDDPMKKAKRAMFLKEYWGRKPGGNQKSNSQNGKVINSKTPQEMANELGMTKTEFYRYLKLNDLIPELQVLVSSGKLGTTAAEQLAYLSPESQTELYKSLGESIAEMKLNEIKDIRAKAVEAERLQKELEEAKNRTVEAEEELRVVKKELYDLQENINDMVADAKKEIEKKSNEKIVVLEAKINRLNEKVEKAEQARKEAEGKVKELSEKLAESKKTLAEAIGKPDPETQKKIEMLQKEIEELKNRPPVVKEPEDYKEIKKRLAERENELLNLTRAQIKLKDRHIVQDLLSELMQAVGKHMKKVEVEFVKLSNDPVVCESVYQCSQLLHKVADEMKGWLTVKRKEEVTIDVQAG